jgi:hypothetical protein
LNAKKACRGKQIPICYHVSFVETRQVNGRLWVHGKFFCIFKGWKGTQIALEWFSGWGMENCMHNIALVATKYEVQKVKFFSFSCD